MSPELQLGDAVQPLFYLRGGLNPRETNGGGSRNPRHKWRGNEHAPDRIPLNSVLPYMLRNISL